MQAYRLAVITGSKPFGKTNGYKDGKRVKGPISMPVSGQVHTQMVTMGELCTKLNDDTMRGMVLQYTTPVAIGTKPLVTDALLANTPGAIARTKEFFTFHSGPGIWMLDIDHINGTDEKNAIVLAIMQAMPQLGIAERIEGPSTGANLFAPDGTQLTGITGWRILLAVDDATKIPALQAALQLKLAEMGKVEAYIPEGCTVKFSVRVRYPVDSSDLENRADYIAGGPLEDGVTQRREFTHFVGTPLNTTMALQLFGVAGLEDAKLRLAAKEAEIKAASGLHHEAKRLNGQAVDLEVERQAKSLKITDKRGIAALRKRVEASRKHRILLPNDMLVTADGLMSVQQILSDRDPNRFNGMRCADPEEPQYRGGELCAVIFADREKGCLKIISYAHGSEDVYTLAWSLKSAGVRERIQFSEYALKKSYENVAETVAANFEPHELYQRDEKIYLDGAIMEDTVLPVHIVDPTVELYVLKPSSDGETFEEVNKPATIIKGPELRSFLRPLLPEVVAETQLPLFENDAITIKNGVYRGVRLSDCYINKLPVNVTKGQAQDALGRIANMFEGFNFSDPTSRVAALSMPFTALLGASFSARPATFIVSSASGVGKSTLAEMVHDLISMEVQLIVNPRDNDALERTLGLIVPRGLPVGVDNLRQGTKLKSDNIASLITSGRFSGRQSGTGHLIKGAKLAGVLTVSAKNALLDEDLISRFLVVSLEARTKHVPIDREAIRANAKQYIEDMATVLSWQPEDVDTKVVSRFPDWEKAIAKRFESLTGINPLSALAENSDMVASSEEAEHLHNIFKVTGGQSFSLQKLRNMAGMDTSDPGRDLHQWLALFKSNVNLGLKLKGMRGQVYGGYTLAVHGDKNCREYVVKEA